MDQKLETLDRIQWLRDAILDPGMLEGAASDALASLPDSCEVLVAYSDEGYAVAVACSLLALGGGRRLPAYRASLLAPLAEGPVARAWNWASMEEVLDLGPPRAWVKKWATSRGGRGAPEASTVAASADL